MRKRLVLSLTLAVVLSLTWVVRATDQPVRYRLVRGGTLTVQTMTDGAAAEPRSSRIYGTFELVRVVSPLDWESYLVTNLSLSAPELAPGGLRLGGSGFYSFGGRGLGTKRMTVNTVIDGRPVEFDSRPVPLEEASPVIAIKLVATRGQPPVTEHYMLDLRAVPELKRWHYEFIGQSVFIDECLICDRPVIPLPARGSFDLVLYEENPILARYHLFELNLRADTGSDESYLLTGEGEYEVGGEVALRQQLRLEVDVRAPTGLRSCVFTNDSPGVLRRWPMLRLKASEATGSDLSTYRLDLAAAPLRDLWFSTRHGMTSGKGVWPSNRIGDGDLLSFRGAVVRANSDLVRAFQLPAVASGYSVDAVDLAPGGQILFSLQQDYTSPVVGQLRHGDLLSELGRVVRRNGDLIGRFGLMPPAPDAGLDAVQVLEGDVVLFSITSEVFAESLGRLLRAGDLLSSDGTVRKTNAELLERFQPVDSGRDYGLDALYVWPDGEVWFSTESGFRSAALGEIMDGDLLSDQGYIVFRNLELVGPFAPLEDLANFGLDGLYVVTDFAAAPVKPAVLSIALDRPANQITLRWGGDGRAFQVEKTADLTAGFSPSSPILAATEWTEPVPANGIAATYYRVRQW